MQQLVRLALALAVLFLSVTDAQPSAHAQNTVMPQAFLPLVFTPPGSGIGQLQVVITDLPANTAGDVTVSGSGSGVTPTHLTQTTTLSVTAGVYSVVAAPIQSGTSTYSAATPTMSVTVASGSTAIVTVDYLIIVPATTTVLSSANLNTLASASVDYSTLVFTNTLGLPSLQPGGVLVAGVTSQTPNGFLQKIMAVTSNSNQVTVTTTPATLLDAVPRGALNVQATLSASDIQPASKGPTSGLHAMANGSILQTIQKNITCSNGSTMSISGSITLSPSFVFTAQWGGFPVPTVTQATFTGSETETADVTAIAQAGASCSLATTALLPTPIYFDDIVVFVGAVPVVLAPQLQLYLTADGNVVVGMTAEATQQLTVTAGVSYTNGTYSPISQTTNSFTYIPPTLPNVDGNVDATLGPGLSLLVYGLIGPEVTINGTLDLTVATEQTPWCTLIAGLDAGGGLIAPSLDLNYSNPAIIPLLSTTLFTCSGAVPTSTPSAGTPTITPAPGTPTATPVSSMSPTPTPSGAGETYTFVRQWGEPTNGQLVSAAGDAIDASGNVYVVDPTYDRIDKYDPTGLFLTQWGNSGTGSSQFNSPQGIAIDASGNVYVSDTGNHRIQRFDTSGAYLGQWSDPSGGGTGLPEGIAVDAGGDVYVTDTTDNLVKKFDPTGVFLTSWGGLGTGPGQFKFPMGLAIDASGTIYVGDQGNSRVEKFDSNGTFLLQWGSSGSSNGQFTSLVGLAIDSQGNVYTVEENAERIQKFDAMGTYITQWPAGFYYPWGIAIDPSSNVYVTSTFFNGVKKFNSTGGFISSWGSAGGSSGQLAGPDGVALDTSGNVWVSNAYGSPGEEFTSAGIYIRELNAGLFAPAGIAIDAAGDTYILAQLEVFKYSSAGTYLTQWGGFGEPAGIALDPSGDVYVTDVVNARVQKFDPNGVLLTQWGSAGQGTGQFNKPTGIAVDASGNIYVADYGNDINGRIQKFTLDGTYLTQWNLQEFGVYLAVDSAGNVYVSMVDYQVQKFDPVGNILASWGSLGAGPGQFKHGAGLAVDASGDVYVVDFTLNRVQEFAPTAAQAVRPAATATRRKR